MANPLKHLQGSEKPTKAIVYGRVSGEHQAENTSLESQIAACKAKAESIGAEIVGSYAEVESGGKYEDRPMIQEALKRIEAGEADALIAYRLDRQGRDAVDLVDIRKRIHAAGGHMLFAEGMEFSHDPMGDFTHLIASGTTQLERAFINARLTKGKREAAEMRGQQPFRTVDPLGYRIVRHDDITRREFAPEMLGHYIIKEEESEIAQFIFEQFATGVSLRRLAKLCKEKSNIRAWDSAFFAHHPHQSAL